ncbi:MAG: ammonia-forming cytochrome c nitrite reductase subunit c552 [Sporomusaceae bacterium]|nr:ammonia-forming cytochrome c nitrite reductase subunit c552 [Sporomusaceae bacterium]
MNNGQKILVATAILLLCFFGVVIVRVWGVQPAATIKTAAIAKGEYDPAVWGKSYPLEYASYQKNKEMKPSPTGYGGSVLVQKWDMQPELKINFAGYGFSIDYKEDRGHVYALIDQQESKRVNAQTVGTCITCKTPYIEKLFAEQGWNYTRTPLLPLIEQAKHPVSCASCHDPENMNLRVVNPAFKEAMARLGTDLTKATREEMRSYVCGQCHAEYYFEPGTNRLVFPWDKGFTPQAMYEYYATKPNGFEKDWVHAVSGAPILKGQHPDFEEWKNGAHGKSGVSCADCHMPYVLQGGQKYTSHHMTSPLHYIKESCLTCHRGQSEAWALDQVKTRQDAVFQMQHAAGQKIAQAHEIIRKAADTQGADPALLAQAREHVRKAQWYWDYVAAANSMGFHNSVQELQTLGQASDLAWQAIQAANQAAGRNLL